MFPRHCLVGSHRPIGKWTQTHADWLPLPPRRRCTSGCMAAWLHVACSSMIVGASMCGTHEICSRLAVFDWKARCRLWNTHTDDKFVRVRGKLKCTAQHTHTLECGMIVVDRAVRVQWQCKIEKMSKQRWLKYIHLKCMAINCWDEWTFSIRPKILFTCFCVLRMIQWSAKWMNEWVINTVLDSDEP